MLLAVIVLASTIASVTKGFAREFLGLVAAVAGIFLGLWFHGAAGAFLLPFVSSERVAGFCGFVLIFFGVLIAGSLAGLAISKVMKLAGLSWIDRLAGALFGAARGLLASIAIVLALVAFGPGLKDGEPPRAVVESRFAPYVLDAAHVLVAIAPRELKDGFAQRYQQVKT
ncbi:MAG: CvpA family protein, partial [Bryobacteraceae bacterium]